MGDTRGRNFHIGDAARGRTTAESSGVRGPGVSDMLRSRRMSLGYELSEIAVALRIRGPAHAHGIEDDDEGARHGQADSSSAMPAPTRWGI